MSNDQHCLKTNSIRKERQRESHFGRIYDSEGSLSTVMNVFCIFDAMKNHWYTSAQR